ncbi:MAG: SAM hydrolase/SAM-dependent halogenase family protein [Actinomycetota bacterium]
MAYGWVALLTDYGRRDGFVAACHGVIARIAPDVRVIDITHDVPPQDIRHGAAVLAQTVPYLPPAVIVGVVDPGVGTARRGVALAAGESVLVGPDNGLLCWAAAALGGTKEAVAIVAREYHLPARFGTFDGRDVFAPVAAHLARGTPLADLGTRADRLVPLAEPEVHVQAGRVETEVLTVDHFGNVQLAAREPDLDAAALTSGTVAVEVNGRTTAAVRGSVFADVPAGGVLLYVDGAGHAAVAVNQGDAASALGAHPADRVSLRRAD